MKRLLLIICTILPMVCMAQNRIVKGVVFNADGSPLAGITVSAENSTTSTQSSDGGQFEMTVSPYTKYVVATAEGYLTARAEIDGSFLVLTLKVDKKYIENKLKAEEEARLAAEKEAKAKAKAEEEARLAAEKEAKAKAKAEEEARLAAEKEARLAAEKEAKAKAKAEEEARLAAEKEVLAKANAEEEARLAIEREAQAKIMAEEKRIAAEAKAAERAHKAEERSAKFAAVRENINNYLTESKKSISGKLEQILVKRKDIKETAKTNLQRYESIIDISLVDLSYNPIYSGRYIGGCRFNDKLYAGIGTGINLNTSYDRYVYSWDTEIPRSKYEIPLFAYCRYNFTNTQVSPFVSLSMGGYYSLNYKIDLGYATMRPKPYGLLFDAKLGVNYRFATKSSVYIATGISSYSVSNISGYDRMNIYLNNSFNLCYDIHLGFTF